MHYLFKAICVILMVSYYYSQQLRKQQFLLHRNENLEGFK